MGTVIRMDSVARSALPSASDEALMRGFHLALWALDAVKICSRQETITAFESWVAAGMLTQEQFSALMEHHGWGQR